jgi:pyruvate formate lyase activating enzyme
MNDPSRELMNKRDFLRGCAACMAGALLATQRTGAGIHGGAEGLLDLLAGDDPGKFSKEAEFYVKTKDGVACRKCPRGCTPRDGELGFCRSRLNVKGKLYSIAYGNPCAVHVDPIEKKPFYHVLPTTHSFSIAAAGCNLRCLNCQNWQISQVSPRETANDDLMPDAVAARARESGCASVAFTYSEPTTFYEYTYDSAVRARKQGLRALLKSNGYINPDPLRRLCGVLDAANIDLKSYDADTFKHLSDGRLDTVLASLSMLKKEGVWLEITNLVIPGWTDDMKTIERMCAWLAANGFADTPLHFTRFTPLYKLNRLPLTPVATLERARDAARKAGLHYPYIGNVPGHAGENTYCHHCGALLLERRGFTILQNRMEKGTCKACRKPIPGIWA